MANRTESIVSGAGMFLSLITALVELVKELGGSVENIHRLITAEGRETLRSIARLIAGNIKQKRFKNWKQILEITKGNHGPDNWQLRRTFFTVNLASDFGKRLMVVYPECFTDEPVKAVPLSVLRKHVREEMNDGSKDEFELHRAEGFLESHGALNEFSIPIICFALTPEAETTYGDPPLPQCIRESNHHNVGDVVEYQFEMYKPAIKLVVVEYNDNNGVDLLSLAPLECIDVSA